MTSTFESCNTISAVHSFSQLSLISTCHGANNTCNYNVRNEKKRKTSYLCRRILWRGIRQNTSTSRRFECLHTHARNHRDPDCNVSRYSVSLLKQKANEFFATWTTLNWSGTIFLRILCTSRHVHEYSPLWIKVEHKTSQLIVTPRNCTFLTIELWEEISRIHLTRD